MRKRIITQGPQGIMPSDEDWLDLENSKYFS
jgi:hypothetical protein